MTQALGELDLLVGLSRHNTQIRWLPPILPDAEVTLEVENIAEPRVRPNWDNLYLFVDEEDGSRLYLKRGSGSSFDVSFAGVNGDFYFLDFGSRMVDALDKDDEDADGGKRLACVSPSDYKGGLRVYVDQRVDEDQQASRATIRFYHHDYFDVEHTPIISFSHGELFKIVTRPWGSAEQQGSTKCVRFHPWSGQVSPYTKTTSPEQFKIRFRAITFKTPTTADRRRRLSCYYLQSSPARRLHRSSPTPACTPTLLYRADRDTSRICSIVLSSTKTRVPRTTLSA